MRIKDFGVEIWMNTYENYCKYNLAETCVESLTVDELLQMSGRKDQLLDEILDMKLTYGDIEGSLSLRTNVANLYEKAIAQNVTITHGGINANALSILTLVEPGDRVISVLPTYQQLYSIPESIGAEVKILRLREENSFLPDLNELKSYVNDNTKLICLNNPNNPTGSLMEEGFLKEIVEIARSCDAYILCDEVYRGLTHEGNNFTVSIADLYEKGISTGSMSKVYSLAGLRLGWVVGPEEFIERVNRQRDYHIISVGMINDRLATIALENKDKILNRNLSIVRQNKKILDEWIAQEARISYVEPKAGTTALLKIDVPMKSDEFCIKLQNDKGVMLLPGSALEMEGYVRIGYCNNTQILIKGLEELSLFLKEI
ncbi:MAG: aminotransferase [Clostridiales bacterium]|nr:aminotransferase [Clostridiales bacterium]